MLNSLMSSLPKTAFCEIRSMAPSAISQYEEKSPPLPSPARPSFKTLLQIVDSNRKHHLASPNPIPCPSSSTRNSLIYFHMIRPDQPWITRVVLRPKLINADLSPITSSDACDSLLEHIRRPQYCACC